MMQLCFLMLQTKQPEIKLEEVVDLFKGFLHLDGKPIIEDGRKVPMLAVWSRNILEAEGVKNDDGGQPQS